MEKVSPHCPIDASISVQLDIIFIHGLGGDIKETWQKSRSSFWPQWIANDFPTCQVYVTGYDSQKFASLLSGSGASIQDVASTIIDEIICEERRAPNVLFICHSLGGLIAKQILRKCKDSADADFNQLGRSIKGFVFLGTPHQGAHLSKAINAILTKFTSKQTKQLSYANDNLVELNDFFRTEVMSKNTLVKSYYETKMTWGVMVVDRVTANPGIATSEPIAVEADHANICKPENKDSNVYKSVSATIRKLLRGAGSSGDSGSENAQAEQVGQLSPLMTDYKHFTTVASDDRRDLDTKLKSSNREHLSKVAKAKKERFSMELQSRIEQPSAIEKYTRIMSDIDTRFKRHILKEIARSRPDDEIDDKIQEKVIDPCLDFNSTNDSIITLKLVDDAFYYLVGNCHLAWDND